MQHLCYNIRYIAKEKGLEGLVCTFFGHRQCFDLDRAVLENAIVELINLGVDQFYVGNQGQFDAMVRSCLKALQGRYPHIRYGVVLAYLPTENSEYADHKDTMYPPIEGHPKFAITRRNRWMIAESDYCICYIDHTWGGAYQFAALAKCSGLTVTNLGKAAL